MDRSVYDFRAFYGSLIGRIVRRVLRQRLAEYWPHVKGLSLLGCGYAVPYLAPYEGEAQRLSVVMPHSLGVHAWPSQECNKVALSEDSAIPLETSSVDRVLLIHGLEFSDSPVLALKEIWRVLKSSGRLIVVVPNRGGFWARAEWSPFGLGAPFSRSQLLRALQESQFVIENTGSALFIPPVRASLFFRSALLFENVGQRFLPFMAGTCMVEASKQLYARAGIDRGSAVPVMPARVFVPKPAGTPP